MTLLDLQDQLRAHIRARIGRGELTGTMLARNAEFPQGHLSNFLNSRRGLSLESMDRLLDALGIGILDLMDSRDAGPRGHTIDDVVIQSVKHDIPWLLAGDQAWSAVADDVGGGS